MSADRSFKVWWEENLPPVMSYMDCKAAWLASRKEALGELVRELADAQAEAKSWEEQAKLKDEIVLFQGARADKAEAELAALREERDTAYERGMREAGKRIFGDRL